MVTSSDVVGSSAMITCGSQDKRNRPHDALLHAAAHLMRIVVHAALRRRHPHLRQGVNGARQQRPGASAVVDVDGLKKLVADGEDGIEGGLRVLEDHRQPAAPGYAASRARSCRGGSRPAAGPGRPRCGRPGAAPGAAAKAPSCSCRSRTRRRCPASRPGAGSKLTPSTAFTTPQRVITVSAQVIDLQDDVTGRLAPAAVSCGEGCPSCI